MSLSINSVCFNSLLDYITVQKFDFTAHKTFIPRVKYKNRFSTKVNSKNIQFKMISQFQVLFTTTVRHAAPVALNMLSNLLGMRYLNWPDFQIFTQNYPIEGVIREPTMKLPKTLELGVIWALFITFCEYICMM